MGMGGGDGGGALNQTSCVDQYQRLNSKISATTRKSTRRSTKELTCCCAQCLSLGGVCSLEEEELGLGHQQRARNHLIHMLIPHRIYVVLIDDLVLILEDAERVEASTVIVLRDFEALVL